MAPRQRLRVPWADFVLFAVIGGVLALWWLRPPAISDSQQVALLSRQRDTVAALTPTSSGSESTMNVSTPTAQPTAVPPTLVPTETPHATPTIPAAPIRHKVQAGDTVSAIAQKYGSTMKEIIQANGLSADGRLSIGQELIVPVAGPMGGLGPTAVPGGAPLVYTVQSGDTISDIALKYGSQIDWILKANNMKPTAILRIGQSLTIPLGVATPTPIPTSVAEQVTPTATPTPERALSAPSLLAPADSGVLTGQAVVLLSWTSVGTLQEAESYVVTLRRTDSATPVATFWTKGTTWRLQAQYRGADEAGIEYIWRVQVRIGSAGQPGKMISPPSAERRFTWK